MHVRHLNCATLCPPLVGEMVCHCLLVELDEGGLVLVDTGLGERDLADRHLRLGRGFCTAVRPRFDPTETARARIEALGHRASDVRHVVLTHLDLDHAGALSDFPDAEVHVIASEHEAAMERPSRKERERYRPAQWAHGPRWRLHAPSGERWMGFDAVSALDGRGDVLLVPLHGHTRGHAGVAVQTASGWLLHCGDAYFHHSEVTDAPRPPRLLDWFQRLMAIDDQARRRNQERLRALARERGDDVTLFCAHDPVELARCAVDPAARSAAS